MDYIENWFRAQNNQKKVISKEHKIVCTNTQCSGGVTEHREFKQFYILPKCFIISLNRGKNYSNTAQVQIPMILNLANKIEMGNSPKEFNLVGMVKRVVNEKKEEYFDALSLLKVGNWYNFYGNIEYITGNCQAPQKHQVILIKIPITRSHGKNERHTVTVFVSSDFGHKRRIPSSVYVFYHFVYFRNENCILFAFKQQIIFLKTL